MARPKKAPGPEEVPCELEITWTSRVGDRAPMSFSLTERSWSTPEHTVKCFEHFRGALAAQEALAQAAGLPTSIEDVKKLLGL